MAASANRRAVNRTARSKHRAPGRAVKGTRRKVARVTFKMGATATAIADGGSGRTAEKARERTLRLRAAALERRRQRRRDLLAAAWAFIKLAALVGLGVALTTWLRELG